MLRSDRRVADKERDPDLDADLICARLHRDAAALEHRFILRKFLRAVGLPALRDPLSSTKDGPLFRISPDPFLDAFADRGRFMGFNQNAAR